MKKHLISAEQSTNATIIALNTTLATRECKGLAGLHIKSILNQTIALRVSIIDAIEALSPQAPNREEQGDLPGVLSPRAVNALKDEKIFHIAQLKAMTQTQINFLRVVPGIGSRTHREIEAFWNRENGRS